MRVLEHCADKEKASSVLLFPLFQEIGGRLWEDSVSDTERANYTVEVMDEFAAALMVLLGYERHVRVQAEYFSSHTAALKLHDRTGPHDSHPLTATRAKQVLDQLDDPELVRRWQHVLIPSLRTEMLQQLHLKPQSWAEPALVERELATRPND